MRAATNTLNAAQWDGFLRSQRYSHPWHSWGWGSFLEAHRGRKLRRYSVQDGDDVLAVYPVCIQPYSFLGKIGESIPVYHFCGPIIKEGMEPSRRAEISRVLLPHVQDDLSRRVLALDVAIWDPTMDDSLLAIWKAQGYEHTQTDSFLYDVPSTVEEIEKNYQKEFFRNVRKGWEKNIQIRRETHPNPDVLWRLYDLSMEHSQETTRYSREELTALCTAPQEMREIFCCFSEGQPAAFGIFLKFNWTGIYLLAGMDREYAKRSPSKIVIDAFLRTCPVLGIKRVDFGGASNPGLRKFKEAIGAAPQPVHRLRKIFHPYRLKMAAKWKSLAGKAQAP